MKRVVKAKENLNVLVIEDNATSGATLIGLLEEQGIENIVLVDDGLVAISQAIQEKPDLIFLDIKMPEVDGWLLCEMFSNLERWADIPVVLQTGLQGRDNIKKGMALGAHSYVEKPMTEDKIANVLTGIFRPPVEFPAGISNRLKYLIERIAETTAKTFNLVLGSQTHTESIRHLDDAPLEENFDFTAILTAEGTARIEVSIGWNRVMATNVCVAFMGLDPEDCDDELLSDGLNEVLNVMFGTTFRDIAAAYPIRLGVPTSGKAGAIPYFAEAPNRYRLDFKTVDGPFSMLMTVVEGAEIPDSAVADDS